jgi:hypothetical protein
MTVNAHLLTLESGGLIRLARLMPEVEYLFRHALLQEAAYHSLVKHDRRMLHQAVGEALEQLYADLLDSPALAPLLARHFAEAGDDDRTLRYAAQAGRAAAQAYANAEAIQHFDRAIQVARRRAGAGPTLTALYLQRGRALELSARDAEALANYADLEAWAGAHGDRAARLAAITARATIYVKPTIEQNPSLGFDLSQQALALAVELHDPAAEARAHWNLLQYHLLLGQNAQALDHGERALAITQTHELREERAYVLTDLLKVYYQVGLGGRAHESLAEARALWRELGQLNMLADNLATTSMLHTIGGNYDQALALSSESFQVAQRVGNVWNQSYALYLVDLAHFDRGDIGQAIAVAEECMRLAALAGFSEGLQQPPLNLGLMYAYTGQLPRALAAARQAQTHARTMPGAIPNLPQVLGHLAYLHALAGQPGEALAALSEYPALLDPVALKEQFVLTQLIVGLAQAELALGQNNPAHALALARQTAAALRQDSVRLFLPDVLSFEARAHQAAGRPAAAEAAFEAARVEAEALGSRRSLWLILAALAALAAARGDQSAAQALYRQAAGHIGYIADHAGPADLRASFLQRPDVAAVLRHAASG